MQEFMGVNNFIWWHGVVEDINDPLKVGRCRVRVFGFHSSDRNLVPIESLPWASPMQPITSAAISGIGTSPTGLLQGSHVFGFFRDGLDAQQPIMLGSFAGIPQDEPKDTGFNDPEKKYPSKISKNYSSVIKEQDTNRLARNDEKIEKSIVATKKDEIEKDIPIANSTDNWNEPETSYDAIYPHNHVHQSESGHVIEIDDTPTKERLHTYHKSGTFEEIHSIGTKVEKIVHDNYKLVMGEEFVHVTGNVNLIVGATGPDEDAKSNITILVRGNAEVQVDGDANAFIGQNLYANVSENMEANVKGNYGVDATGEIVLTSGSGIKINAKDAISMKSEESKIDISADKDIIVKSGDNIKLN
jgi:hypothetical protein